MTVDDALEICAELEADGPPDDDAMVSIHPRLLLTLASEVLRLRAIGPAAMDGHAKAEAEGLWRRLELAHDDADRYQLRALDSEAQAREVEAKLARVEALRDRWINYDPTERGIVAACTRLDGQALDLALEGETRIELSIELSRNADSR